MSTAAAPVSERSAALQERPATTCSTPASAPLTTRRRLSAMLAIISSFSEVPASQRVSPAVTSVATTTSPDFSAGSSPPATPKLMTPRNVDESSVASRSRNCLGSLLLQMTIMPGPAAMRASCCRPVTIKTGRGSIACSPIELPTNAAAPAVKVTSRPLPPCCWCSSNFGTAPAPRAGRTLSSHGIANKTRAENRLPCAAAHPTDLFRSVCFLGTQFP